MHIPAHNIPSVLYQGTEEATLCSGHSSCHPHPRARIKFESESASILRRRPRRRARWAIHMFASQRNYRQRNLHEKSQLLLRIDLSLTLQVHVDAQAMTHATKKRPISIPPTEALTIMRQRGSYPPKSHMLLNRPKSRFLHKSRNCKIF
ncbi:unnamed protein product [Ectocarpus fasciculatus]